MKRHWSIYWAVALIAWIGCILGYGASADASGGREGEPPPLSLVGKSGDPRNIVFEGNQAFSNAQLLTGLKANLDYQLAAHPLAPRAEYLESLQRLVQAGYFHSGFPAAQVKASQDAASGKVRVIIVEGPRYNCGDIRVIGARTLTVEPFIRQLAEYLSQATNRATVPVIGQPDVQRQEQKTISASELTNRVVRLGIWNKGDPASFDPPSLVSLADTVTNTLATFGYFFAKVRVQVVPESGKGTAALQLEILEEGPRGVIDTIEIMGAGKNNREEILKYLGLAPGMPLDRDLIQKAEQALWQSGRFLAYTLTPQPPDKTGKLTLRLELREYDEAPPLTREFTRNERALLQLREWLEAWPSRGEDLHLILSQVPSPGKVVHQLQWVLSSSGLAIALEQLDSQTPASRRLLYAFVGTPRMHGFYSAARQRKLEATRLRGQFQTWVSMLPKPNPTPEDHFELQLGAGFNVEKSDRPFAAQFKLAPAAFVSLAQSKKLKYTYDHERLTITGEDATFICNPESGRPEMLSFRLREKAPATGGFSLGDLEGKIAVEPGAFAKLNREIRERFANQPNLYSSNAPLSSTVAFVLDDLLQVAPIAGLLFREMPAEKVRLAATSLEKLMHQQQQILAPLDRLNLGAKDEEKPFFVPNESGDQPNVNNSVAAIGSGFLLRLSTDLLPPGCWAATLAREAALVFVGKTKYTGQVLEAILQSPEAGPLNYWVAAELLAFVNPQASQAFAYKGLNRLLAEDFRRDYRVFLEGDSILTQCLVNLAAAWRDMNDSDLDGLASVLRPAESDLLRQAAAALRQHKGQPLYPTLAPALDAYWKEALNARVRVGLLRLALRQTGTGASASPVKPSTPAAPPQPSPPSITPADAEAQFQRGWRLAHGQGQPTNAVDAAKWYRRAADQGHAVARGLEFGL